MQKNLFSPPVYEVLCFFYSFLSLFKSSNDLIIYIIYNIQWDSDGNSDNLHYALTMVWYKINGKYVYMEAA